MTDRNRQTLDRRTLLGGLAGFGLLPASTSGPTFSSTDETHASQSSSLSLTWQWTDAPVDGPSSVRALATRSDGTVVCVGVETGGTQHILLRGLDSDGNENWSETVARQGNDAALGVTVGNSGDVVFCGGTQSRGSSFLDTTVGRFGPPDTLTWFPPYGRSGTNDAGHAITQTQDGGYIIAGGTHYLGGGSGEGVGRLLAVDKNGAERWDQTYETSHSGELYDIVRTGSGEYAFAGTRESTDGTDEHVWLGAVDDAGTLQWSETHGGVGSRTAYSIVEAHDGGFVFAGTTTPPGTEPTAWVGKTDAVGGLEWEETYGTAEANAATDIRRLSGGGYLVAGWTAAGGADDGWLFRINSTGAVMWADTYGGSDDDRFNDLTRTDAGQYVVGGVTTSGTGMQSGWVGGTGTGGDYPAELLEVGQQIDQLTFLRGYPGDVADELQVDQLLEASLNELSTAVDSGSIDPDTEAEAIERLQIGHEATLELLQLASDGADGVDETGNPVSTVNMSRRTAKYLITLVVDVILTVLIYKKIAIKLVPKNLPVDEDVVRSGVEEFISALLESGYLSDLVQYIRTRTGLEGISFFNEYIWEPGTAVVSTVKSALETLVTELTNAVAWVVQGAYETNTLQTSISAPGTPPALPLIDRTAVTTPDREPGSTFDDGFGIHHYGVWGSVYRMNEEFIGKVTDGQLLGDTAAAAQMAESTVDDVSDKARTVANWQENLVDTLLDINFVEKYVEYASAVWDIVQQIIDTTDELTDLWESAIEAVGGLLGNAVDWILDLIEGAYRWTATAANSFADLASDVKTLVMNPWEAAESAGELATEMITQPGDVEEFVIESTDGAAEMVVTHTEDTVGIIAQSTDGIMDEVVDAIEENDDVLVEVASDASDVLEEGANLYMSVTYAIWTRIEAGIAFGIQLLGLIPAAAGVLSGGATLNYATEKNVDIVSSVVHGDGTHHVSEIPDLPPADSMDDYVEEYANFKETLDGPLEDVLESSMISESRRFGQ